MYRDGEIWAPPVAESSTPVRAAILAVLGQAVFLKVERHLKQVHFYVAHLGSSRHIQFIDIYGPLTVLAGSLVCAHSKPPFIDHNFESSHMKVTTVSEVNFNIFNKKNAYCYHVIRSPERGYSEVVYPCESKILSTEGKEGNNLLFSARPSMIYRAEWLSGPWLSQTSGVIGNGGEESRLAPKSAACDV